MRLDASRAVCRVASSPVLRHDVPASFVVFLVAVPLSLGIAVASGAPPAAGLLAAAVGGIVAGLLGGAPLQVSGPAAGLTVVVASHIEQFGWRTACAITFAAGLIQVILGLSRIARAALAISPTVVHAMLAGIGTTIALAQLQVVLGGHPAAEPYENLAELPHQVTNVDGSAALLGSTVILVLVAWHRLPWRLRAVPAPLVAVVAVTGLAELGRFDVTRLDLGSSLAGAIGPPSLPDSDLRGWTVAAITLAAVASVETLLSATAVEKMRPGQRTSYDQELVAQGAANSLSGLLGGLPVSGVIVRSSANVAAGATGRAAAVLHGVWVLVFSLLLVGLVERIPMTVLAALLVVVGCRLIRPAHWRTARQHGELAVYVVSASGVVIIGLLEGVLLGIGLSMLLMARRVVRAHVRVEPAPTPGATGPTTTTLPHWMVVAEGTLSFLSVPRLSRRLAEIPAGSVVTLHLLVDFLDHAVADHLRSWKQQHEAAGGLVLVDETALAPRSLR